MTNDVLPNPQKGEVKLEIAGTQYTFRITTNAMAALEGVINISLFDLVRKLNTGTYRVGEVRALIWAALQDEHPDVSLAHAGKLIDAAGGLEGLTALLEQLMDVSSPDADPRKARRPATSTKRRRGIGASSSKTRGVRA